MEGIQDDSQPGLLLDYMESCNDLSLLLILFDKDPLFAKKKKLLHARGFDPEVRVFLSCSESPHQMLKVLIEAARVIHLDEAELYFAGVDTHQLVDFYSPRNELEALRSILSLIDISVKSAGNEKMDTLHLLRAATIDVISAFGDRCCEVPQIDECTSYTEDLLLRWGEDHGVRTKLQIAHFKGAGRGALASETLKVGDIALEIPESLIISEELVYESDMFHVLEELDGISTETMLLLWSMRERHQPESKYKIYFETLPETFNTGLSFGIEALATLEGTFLFEEIIQAKEHLRSQYDVLCPSLCNDHPTIFKKDQYTWDCFLWACELWYSNSMKVIFSDGKIRTCLVPVAGFLNHSLCPHILHYGRVDLSTKSLKFSLSRPCGVGEQCFLSYGKLSTSHLITFYGFLPKGENFYDVIPLDIDAPQADESGICPESDWTMHMVRGTWLSSNHGILHYGLPPSLLNFLRYALNENGDKLSTETCINVENERTVLETLNSIFSPMLDGLVDTQTFPRENLSWDVKLAMEYKDLQIKIMSSVLASCSAGLEMLESLEPKTNSPPAQLC